MRNVNMATTGSFSVTLLVSTIVTGSANLSVPHSDMEPLKQNDLSE